MGNIASESISALTEKCGRGSRPIPTPEASAPYMGNIGPESLCVVTR